MASNPLDQLQLDASQSTSSASTPWKADGTSKTNDPDVYMGGRITGNRNPVLDTLNPSTPAWQSGNPIIDLMHPAQGRKVASPSLPSEGRTVSQSAALLEFYQWSPEQRNQWGDYLVSIGYLPEAKARDYQSLRGAWNDVIDQSAAFTAAGRFVNPHDVAKLMAGPGTAGTAAEAPFTGARTTTDTAVDLTDPAGAKALVNGILAQTLGRDATPEEMTAFRNTLTASEKANPTTVSTTTNYVNDAQTSQSSTKSGGLTDASRQQMIMDQAMQKPDYGAYQAATTYYNALLGALGSPV